eukprot:386016-Prymnesium_polylepis.1
MPLPTSPHPPDRSGAREANRSSSKLVHRLILHTISTVALLGTYSVATARIFVQTVPTFTFQFHVRLSSPRSANS